MSAQPHPEPPSTRSLIARAQEGDTAARDEVVRRNMGLVHQEARRRAAGCAETTAEELVQEGVLGLLIGIDRFDPSRDTQFTTFAIHWVRHMMRDRIATERGRGLGGATYLFGNRHHILQKYEAQVAAGADPDDTLAALAAKRGLSKSQLAGNLDHLRSIHIVSGSRRIFSEDGDSPTSMDSIRAAGEDMEDRIDQVRSDAHVRRIVSRLRRRLRADVLLILDRRIHPRDDGEPLGLRELGEEIGLSGERVRQLERELVAVLREALTTRIIPKLPPRLAHRRD